MKQARNSDSKTDVEMSNRISGTDLSSETLWHIFWVTLCNVHANVIQATNNKRIRYEITEVWISFVVPHTHCLPYSYAMLQLKGMQEFTGDGCTHGQAWVAIFNRSTTCMDPHSHFPLPTPCSAYVSLGFPRTRPERDTGSTTYLTVAGSEPHSVANLHPVSPVKSHVQDFFSLRNEASFLNWKTWIIDQ